MTNDEKTVLMIANEAPSILALGRWKEPVLSLTLVGLLKKADALNYVITDRGRAMLKQTEQQDDEAFRVAFAGYSEARNLQVQSVQSYEQAATHLSFAARAASKLNGQTPNQSAWEISQAVLQRAMELLKEPPSDSSH